LQHYKNLQEKILLEEQDLIIQMCMQSADKLGFTGPGGGFKSAGTNENFSNKTGRGRTGY
jgi:hypothetical protein